MLSINIEFEEKYTVVKRLHFSFVNLILLYMNAYWFIPIIIIVFIIVIIAFAKDFNTFLEEINNNEKNNYFYEDDEDEFAQRK